MDPPQCVQNAMMTKDKKPFTYTPGGIDLSEARSPRLQRRIERNAHLGGVSDTPQHPAPHPTFTGPIPPSALAAMRPQPQVQVFPSGPPPPAPMRGGGSIPPPPPLQQRVPPPPPPPTAPLPTQKVKTVDNQVLERPDMTKIIPDNPMLMLRKTSGPQPRKSLVDQMFEEASRAAPMSKSPQIQAQQQVQSPQHRIQPGGAPASPVPQQTNRPPPQQHLPQSPLPYQPQPQYSPPVQQSVPVKEQFSQPSYPEHVKEPSARYEPPAMERKAPENNGKQEVKTSSAHLGSLYIPPVNQQQKRIASAPSPPERNVDSPGLQTPPLREAPRPWQAKKTQEETPAWAKKDNPSPSNVEVIQVQGSQQQFQPQQRWPQSQNLVSEPSAHNKQHVEQPVYNQQFKQQQFKQDSPQNQQPIGIRIDIRTKPQSPYQDNSDIEHLPNVVYVTQPMVMQHPGQNLSRQQSDQRSNNKGGTRVIPVHIEGAQTAGNERVLNRQQSRGSNPIQSNSFKVLQKFTNTDGEDDLDNGSISQHSPKYPQSFQQPADQIRRMKIGDGEQNITNTFRQVSHSQSPQQKGPQVRTIPIQIEGDEPPMPYVHPSEQVVPEPKKYTGSSIPSRSFKILQAMTAPNDYATVEEQNEEVPFYEWAYPPHHPPYPYPPYWYDYYRYYYPEETNKTSSRSSFSRSTSPATSGRSTPLPFWGYAPSYYAPSPKSGDNGKEVPPLSYNYDSCYPSEQEGSDTASERSTPQNFVPYYDPYYYHYYYGFPPMYPPYPRYSNSDTDSTINDYSSMEENRSRCQQSKQPDSIKVPTEPMTKENVSPTLYINELVTVNGEEEDVESTTDCETDTETDDDYNKRNPLQSMRSITNINNINVSYSSDEENSKEDVQSECSNEDIDDNSSMCYEEDAYPHQLSVIMEESERAESRLRSLSILSDSTTIAERSDTEEDILEDNKDKTTETTEDVDNIEPAADDDDRNSDESEDWWGIIGKEDDDLPKPVKSPIFSQTSTIDEQINHDNNSEYDNIEAEDFTTETTPTGELESANNERNTNKDDETKDDVSCNDNTEYTVVRRVKKKPEDTQSRPKNIYAITETTPTSELESANNEKHTKNDDETKDEGSCNEYTEYTIVRRVKTKPEDTQSRPTESLENTQQRPKSIYESLENIQCNSRPRSIYESLEDIQSESTGSLIKVDNFVGILEQIKQESGFWSQADRTKAAERKTENFDKETYGGNVSDKDKVLSSVSLENYKINTGTKKIDCSTDYIGYNCSVNSTPVLENNATTVANADDNNSDTGESQTEDSCDTSDSSSSEKDDRENSGNIIRLTDDANVKIPTIKDRIQSLRNSIMSKKKHLLEQDSKLMVKTVTELTNRSKTASSKSSLKSFEEFSEEEEIDSGVTSDMSRHISDTEEFPELKKLTKYQRAATHSRLFKLLQEECNNEDNNENYMEQSQKLDLDLDLDKNSRANEKLINELVDSLLKLKKGKSFKHLPKEKLYAAAAKILEEDMEIAETTSDEWNSFLSPARPSTGYSTEVQTPQEFDDYKQYYESWDRKDDNDILQTFKQMGSSIVCPKVLSSKNIHKKLIRLLESSENSSQSIPDKPPLHSNDVTSVS